MIGGINKTKSRGQGEEEVFIRPSFVAEDNVRNFQYNEMFHFQTIPPRIQLQTLRSSHLIFKVLPIPRGLCHFSRSDFTASSIVCQTKSYLLLSTSRRSNASNIMIKPDQSAERVGLV